MRTREEHLDFCKQRALAYLDVGEIDNAVTSMLSDLGKHPETTAIGQKLSMLAIIYMMNKDIDGARGFIEGFR